MIGSGCGDNSNQLSKPSEKDARASFEAFVQEYLSKTQAKWDEKEKAEEKTDPNFVSRQKLIPSKTLYDVRKSNSLVTPYEGTIHFFWTHEIVRSGNPGDPSILDVSENFGYHDGKWEEKK
jgi:hypothetical protein